MLPPSNPPSSGPNPLFSAVIVVLLAGALAGAVAGDAELLRSNLLYRVAVGAGVALAGYIAVVLLWLAWNRRTLTKFGIAGHTLESDPATRDEIRDRDLEVAEFMGTTTKAIEELQRRVEALERSIGS